MSQETATKPKLNQARPRNLLCSCCGGRTIGHQWHNRDAGYGLCDACHGPLTEKLGEDRMREIYGIPGRHCLYNKDAEWCLASKDRSISPRVWNVYDSYESALKAIIEAGEDTYEPATIGEVMARTKAFWIKPARRCTEEDFDNLMETVPPARMDRIDGMSRVFCGEMLTGRITACAAQLGDRFVIKSVDMGDRSTWITVAELEAAYAEGDE